MKHQILLLVATILSGMAAEADPVPFDQQQELLGISFQVTSLNQAVENTVRILPKGLQIDNSAIEMDVQGEVTRIEVADINADYSPEIYIYLLEAGSDKRMALLAFSSNNKKSLSGIYLPALSETQGADKGYCGNDVMAAVESVFMRRFPLCNKAERLTDKTRQLQYKLRRGEAGLQLKLDKMMEY